MSDPMTIEDAIQLLHDTRTYWTAPMLQDAAADLKSEADAMLARGDIDEETHEQVTGILAQTEGREVGAWAQSRELQQEARELMQVFAPADVLLALTDANPYVDNATP